MTHFGRGEKSLTAEGRRKTQKFLRFGKIMGCRLSLLPNLGKIL